MVLRPATKKKENIFHILKFKNYFYIYFIEVNEKKTKKLYLQIQIIYESMILYSEEFIRA